MKPTLSLILCVSLLLCLALPAAATDKEKDRDPPVLHSFQVDGSRFTAGDKVTLRAWATDADSGIKSVTAYFRHDSGGELSVPMLEDPDSFDGENYESYIGTISIRPTTATGTYTLHRVLLVDVSGNMASYRADAVSGGKSQLRLAHTPSFTAAGSASPLLRDVSASIDGTTVTVTLAASGLGSATLLFKNEDNGRGFTVSMGEDDLLADGRYRKVHTLSTYEPHGTFTLKQVSLSGQGGDSVTYKADPDQEKPDQAPLAVSASFQVTGTLVDQTPPEASSVVLGQPRSDRDKEQSFYPLTVVARDDASGVESIIVTFQNLSTGETVSKVLREKDRGKNHTYTGDLKVDFDADKGQWVLDRVVAYDHAGNRKTWNRTLDSDKVDGNKAILPFTASFTR